jgi:RNA polymerase sigma factor (sigma-70 family)
MAFSKNHSIHNQSDEQLLELWKKTRKISYWAALYDRYTELVYGVCLKYLDPESAKDAVMQLFEDLLEKTQNHEIEKFRSWLFVVTRNHCLMQLRSNKHKILPLEEAYFMEKEPFLHPDLGMEREKQLVSMEKCLETLPAEQKASVNLFYLEQKSYRQISEEMGYTLPKVKSYIQNGKRNLKNCMEQAHE